MTQISNNKTPCGAYWSEEKEEMIYDLVDWQEATFYVKWLLTNPHGVWAIFPPEEGKYCIHHKRQEGHDKNTLCSYWQRPEKA